MKLKAPTKWGHDEWNINAACRKFVAPISKRFGMNIEAFLQKLSARDLGKQPCFEKFKAPDKPPPGFTVTPCSNENLWRRIERAAASDKETTTDFVWSAVVCHLEGVEEPMIVDPNDGRAIAGVHYLEPFRTRHIYKNSKIAQERGGYIKIPPFW